MDQQEMHQQEMQVPEQGYNEFFMDCRTRFLAECMLTPEQVAPYVELSRTTGFTCIPLATRDEQNILGSLPPNTRLYKHVFLQTKNFKNEVVAHFRKLGFGWVDIVPLNRVDWYIFLWPMPENTRKQFHKKENTWNR